MEAKPPQKPLSSKQIMASSDDIPEDEQYFDELIQEFLTPTS